MYYRSVLFLLSLFVAAVTSQTSQACIDAATALAANQPCVSAFSDIGDAIDRNTSISVEDLNVYCVPGCRNLVNRVLTCSADSTTAISLNQFICSVDSDGMSCYDFLFSARYATLNNDIETVCPDDIPDGQMCSSACQTAFQNYVINGGCCVAEIFEFAAQFADEELDELIAQCPIDLSRGGTCTEIGGATGLKAFASVLLFAVTFAVAVF